MGRVGLREVLQLDELDTVCVPHNLIQFTGQRPTKCLGEGDSCSREVRRWSTWQ